MSKKNISKLNKQDEEWFRDKSLKERKLAVDGKPDATDIENLASLFKLYDQSTGGLLRRFCNQLAIERSANGRDISMKSVDKEERLAFALPQDLQLFMERYYPSLWTNQAHVRWFLKHFPVFRR